MRDYSVVHVFLQSPDEARPLSPVDPNALRDLELQAKKVASSLDYIMENLHNSLHAVSIIIVHLHVLTTTYVYVPACTVCISFMKGVRLLSHQL